jgi:Lon protease-like protein
MGMSLNLEELPLFPLNTVLFPYADIRLHVFEPRYLEMVRDCMDEDRPFGIVLIRSGSEVGPSEPYLVGTAVRIVHIHSHDDGSLDIQVHGERRFRIREIEESKPYLVGYVEPVIELPMEDDPTEEEVLAEAREAFELYMQHMLARFEVRIEFPEDPTVLSFTMANLLPMSNFEKQRLLEVTDTIERVSGLMPILRTQTLEAKPDFYRLRADDFKEWITPN